ncbi:MAG: hypothetical protein ABSB35_17485 [Bryobacteraceae bacterium]|jgi:hypothetical protein
MHIEWIAFEHYRIHVIEQWPDGPRKQAGLASARSALDRVVRTMPEGSSFACAICASRRQIVTEMPGSSVIHKLPSTLAA